MTKTTRFDVLELQIKHEHELRMLSEASSKLALEKQALEYERRLSDLNHAHTNALKDKAEFLQRSVYESSDKNFQAWKLEITKSLAAYSVEQKASQRTWAILVTLISLTIAVAGLLMKGA